MRKYLFLIACCLVGAYLEAAQLPAENHSDAASVRVVRLKEAAALMDKKEYKNVEAVLNALLKADPKDAVALNLLGLLRLQQNRALEARSLFEEAVQTGRPILGPYLNLARLDGSDRPEQALTELDKALKIAPGNGQASQLVRSIAHNSALSYMQRDRRDAALSILEKASRLIPSDPDLLYELGMVSLENGKPRQARESLSLALHYRPDFPNAFYAMARADLADNRPEEAESLMRRYLKSNPQDASGQYGLGYILVAEQKLNEAKAAFESSLELRPEQTESLFQLGEIALQQNEIASATECFHRVLEQDPKHAGALTESAVLQYRAAHYKAAKDLLERAIASTPNYQKAHYFHALTLIKLGDKEAADKEFAVAQSLQKAHGDAGSSGLAQP